ncbi:major facilitator superfamily domain-containing protein [Leptodontidium sp. 2 PMI_412]|nr:major facilitator superfamily domain-containing protein [Leptodontidium sp. 2 PMI_412]
MADRTNRAESGDLIEPVFANAPGTEILMDDDGPGTSGQYLHTLQHAKTGDGHILLVPQPSLTDPNDPLRWSTPWKWTVLMNGVAYAFNGAVTGPMMAGGMIQLSEFFGKSLTYLTYANGATLICQGFGNLLWMPLAVKYGRRPVYLLSNFLMGVACIWLAIASETTYVPFIIGRAFLGLFEAPIEAIVPSTGREDIYLRPRSVGGNEIGPLVSAFIIQTLSMRWAFFTVAISIFINQITLIFAMPETKFIGARPQIQPSRLSSDEKVETGNSKTEFTHFERASNDGGSVQSQVSKKSYLQSLAFCPVIDHSVSLRKTFLRPFVLMTYPTVLWSSIVYGMSLGWNVILGASVAQLFAPPPYLFNSGAQGLIFISPFIGSLVGTYLCGPLADNIANWATKKNRGIREPEMRLPTCAIAVVLTFVGALIAALTYQAHTHWAGPIVGFGVLSAGAQMGATLAMAYSLDCHKELSGELMVTISCLKSLIAWIWTWVINDWIASDGIAVAFMTIAAVNVAVYLTTIIFYFKGKSFRMWIHNANLMKKVGLE